jgi:MerR family transcriptional regulator, copper efflux regulator
MLISKIAKIAGMSKDGIRHYEEMGLINSTPRHAGSRVYREYDPAVLETIEMIRQAQRLGLSLKEIGPLLKAYGSTPISAKQTIAFLEERLRVIREKQAALREIEEFICAKLARYRSAEAAAGKSVVARRTRR